MRADILDIIALIAAVTLISPDSLSALSVRIHIVIGTCTDNIKSLDSGISDPSPLVSNAPYIHVLL